MSAILLTKLPGAGLTITILLLTMLSLSLKGISQFAAVVPSMAIKVIAQTFWVLRNTEMQLPN
jgi:hypothetical protein